MPSISQNLRRSPSMIVLTLALAACSLAGSAGSAAPIAIEAGKTFSLQVGQVAQVGDGGLQVGFDGVTADSRCPKGAQCVWAGNARVRVWLQQGAGPRQARELHTAPGAAQTASALDHALRLVRLDPYPVAGQALAPQAYVATLELSRGASAAPER